MMIFVVWKDTYAFEVGINKRNTYIYSKVNKGVRDYYFGRKDE